MMKHEIFSLGGKSKQQSMICNFIKDKKFRQTQSKLRIMSTVSWDVSFDGFYSMMNTVTVGRGGTDVRNCFHSQHTPKCILFRWSRNSDGNFFITLLTTQTSHLLTPMSFFISRNGFGSQNELATIPPIPVSRVLWRQYTKSLFLQKVLGNTSD